MTRAEQREEPDVVLPVQFFHQLRTHAPNKCGEYRLLVAVLEDAVRCFQQYAAASDAHGRRLFQEAEQWIADRGDGPEPSLSFEYICAVLGLDPEYLREGLGRWRQARLGDLKHQTA